MLHFDQNRQLEWQLESDDHYVHLHPTDLVEFLCQHPVFSSETADLFRQFCMLILAIEHHLYRQRHEQLMYVYLRMFKNIPKQDIDMMLPGSGIQMNWLDHSKILLPSLFTAGMALWRIMKNVFLIALFGVFKTVGIAVLVLIAVGYGIKNLFTFRSNVVRRYQLNMTQSLYYQSLDNNAGVLLRILSEGEQQDSCESILVYFVCAQSHDKPLPIEAINFHCKSLLREATGLVLNFDARKATENLLRLGLLRFESGGWQTLSLPESIVQLDKTWDEWFNGSDISISQSQ